MSPDIPWTSGVGPNSISGDVTWTEVQDGSTVPEPATDTIANVLYGTVDTPWTASAQ